MAPCGMSKSLPLPDGFLLFVVRYSLVPGGRLAKLAKLFTGNCSVAITEDKADKRIARKVCDNKMHDYTFILSKQWKGSQRIWSLSQHTRIKPSMEP